MNEKDHYLKATLKSVAETQAKMLRAITYTVSVLILPALFIAVKGSVENKVLTEAVVYVIAYIVWLLFGVILIEKIKYKVRSILILLIIFLLGSFVLATRGLSGGGILFLTSFCVMSTALIGLKFGLLAIAMSLFAIIGIGLSMVHHLLPFDPDIVWNSASVFSWLIAGAVFSVLTVCMVWTSGILQMRLLKTLSELRHSQEKITSQNMDLINEIKRRKDIEQQKKEVEKYLSRSQRLESIGTLAGGIAHDFNNILFPVLGHTEMLLEDIPEGDPFRDNLNQIHAGALRAKDLVKQILTFSRQENNEWMLMKIQPVIKEVLKLIRSSIPTTIDIKQDIRSDCGVIKADPTQIHQIVMNLTTNAYHAMEKTGGVLKASLKEIELSEQDLLSPDMEPGAYALLTISDTGTGMDKAVTEKIFDPFFTTKGHKGTGMGLSVVHGIVAKMDGAIQVNSEPGKGTAFHVYLPVEKRLSEKSLPHSNPQIQGGTEQILLVDDEDDILTMEKRMLERLGYNVISRKSSIEALEAFSESPDKFDLVITDIAMPNLPGDKLSAELTKIRPDIPVLLCTGFSETMSEEKAASLGIKGFLLKPIVMTELSQKIREILDENKH
ncbi:ATP-binding protein [Desulfobacula sp.]|uniref:ATP-binding protein n=1 Tax=Desulfobacula sp. TaxID=2593537 RepID=UPI00260EEE8E|nr:ATP-binding protein [Desulfobacula sp.]